MRKKEILILPGDGIGPEVCEAALPVLELFNLPLNLTYGDIGWHCWCTEGTPVPERTWQKIKKSDAILLGATTSYGKRKAEAALPERFKNTAEPYVSPIVQLRQNLKLYANIRPCQSITGSHKPFNLCVIRENTEGLYSGIDTKGIPEKAKDWIRHPNIDVYGAEDASCAVRLQTRFGLERLFHKAFVYAQSKGLSKVTLADKPNVLRESGQFSQDIFFSIAENYPSISAEVHNVDAIALWMVKRPETFGVIVAENMFGDILSDLAAGIMGGLGLAPSANVGKGPGFFEPVHGSFPRMAGKNKVNPSAMFMTIALMLDDLGFSEEARSIEQAVRYVVREAINTTYDLGGTSSTRLMAETIMTAIRNPQKRSSAYVITVGDELLQGKQDNSNQTEISKRLEAANCCVKRQAVCADKIPDITREITQACGNADLLVIAGGLGPTPDDVTREAVASALGVKLSFSTENWLSIETRLKRFGINPDASNKRQAFFPEKSHVISNSKGTAPGFFMHDHDTTVVVLPGPPGEMLPMLDSFLSAEEKNNAALPLEQHQWMLLGAIESEISSKVNNIINNSSLSASYLWKYPYVFVTITAPDNKPDHSELIKKVNAALAAYLVSHKGETACQQLKRTAGIKWMSSDEKTMHVCCKPLMEIQRKNQNTNDYSASIETTPALSAALQNEIISGKMKIECCIHRANEKRTFSIETPLRDTEIIEFIKEFSAWSYMQSCDEIGEKTC